MAFPTVPCRLELFQTSPMLPGRKVSKSVHVSLTTKNNKFAIISIKVFKRTTASPAVQLHIGWLLHCLLKVKSVWNYNKKFPLQVEVKKRKSEDLNGQYHQAVMAFIGFQSRDVS